MNSSIEFTSILDGMLKDKSTTNQIPETFLEIINRQYREVYLSSIIAYAMKKQPDIIRKLCDKYCMMYGCISPECDFNNAEVRLERGMDNRRADIFVTIPSRRDCNTKSMTLTIENKTYTSEHGDQTQKYYNWVKDNYNESTNCFVFLHPDDNKCEPKCSYFMNYNYSELNMLIDYSDDAKITDLKNHIEKFLEGERLMFKDYEINAIKNYRDFKEKCKEIEKKITSRKTELINEVIAKLESDHEIIIDGNEILSEEEQWLGTLGSFRIYRKDWFRWEKNSDIPNYYFYVEIWFNNEESPFEVHFQRTIKDYEKGNSKSLLYNFIVNMNCWNPDSHYNVLEKWDFISQSEFDTDDWKNDFVESAANTLKVYIGKMDATFNEFKGLIENK